MIEIRLDGDPVAKGRHRSRFLGMKTNEAGKSVANIIQHPDERTARYEDRLALAAQAQMIGKPLLEGPLALVLDVYLGIPASWSRRKREGAASGDIRPTRKPDADNFLKIACDALNAVVWFDDSQIVDARVRKFYDLRPGINLRVDKLSQTGL